MSPIFINSLGWIVPIRGIWNQAFVPFISIPKKSTRIRDIMFIR